MTLVPLSIYFDPRSVASLDLGLAKHGMRQAAPRNAT